MAQQFGVGPTSSHAAVLSYSDRPRLIGGFYDHLMGRSFDDIVDSVTLTGGRRNIQEVLKQTQRLLTSARPTVPYVVFLITYGQQASELGSQRLTEMVQSVRDVGGTLYLIGVGVDDNNPQLQSVVQRPGDFFKIPSSSDLNSYVPSIAYHVVSRTGKLIKSIFFILISRKRVPMSELSENSSGVLLLPFPVHKILQHILIMLVKGGRSYQETVLASRPISFLISVLK